MCLLSLLVFLCFSPILTTLLYIHSLFFGFSFFLLGAAYPNHLPQLLPTDLIQRAKVREIVEIVNSLIQPMQNKLTVQKVAEMDKEFGEWLPNAVKSHLSNDSSGHHHSDKEDNKPPNFWPHQWIHKGFIAIEGLIDDTGPYCFGSSVTLADTTLVPQVIGAKLYQIDMTLYPKISRVFQSVSNIPEVKEKLSDVLSRVK